MKSSAEECKIFGNKEFLNKNFIKAINYYSRAIELNPDEGIYYGNRE